MKQQVSLCEKKCGKAVTQANSKWSSSG
jgi:hypothetical protein